MKMTDQKTIEQHRAEFIEWANKEFDVQDDEELNMSNYEVRFMLKGWLAARGIKESQE